MAEDVEKVADLLREVADLHHRYYRVTDGADDDWPEWYAAWLVDHSELPDVLGRRPSRSSMTALLLQADRQEHGGDAWEVAYARLIVRDLGRASRYVDRR
jgi:hypothetical protein